MAVPTVASAALPRPDHIVVAIHENHGYSQVVGTSAAPYINSLAAGGANFTNYHGVTHPSQGNYIAMFSGSTQGVTNDNCPQSFVGKDNLARQLLDVNLTFKLFAETMPSVGYTGCSAGSTPGDYQRKHNPVPNFNNVPSNLSVPFTGLPSDFSTLPTVSWVVPNECNDMHNCSVGTGDSWTQSKLSAYATWAKTHNSLLVVTFDENDCFILCNIFDSTSNKIATIIYGDHVKTGNYSTLLNHYSLLRTIEDMYGLRKSGSAATATAITNAWL
ncbi:MAG: hypothetical protein JHC87_04060, partial [Thermoleophilaceae bacterium]|nr:hypothetical protein [Thermoleophilaceae bacterium]